MTPRPSAPGFYPKAIAAMAGCLVFQGEFMAGKQLLPEFGGAAYVWCSAILFFQLILIAGYYGSRWLTEIPASQRNRVLTALGMSGFLTLLPRWHAPLWFPLELQPLVALLPFAGVCVALFSTTPLLHQNQSDRTDFSIYAWSNAGALFGLVSYPLAVEPLTNLRVQNWVWTILGFMICAIGLRSSKPPTASINLSSSLGKTRWQWWVLPAISSATLLATTNRLAYEASAGPLTWAMPLAIFLLAYIWAFSGTPRRSMGILCLLALITLVATYIMVEERSPFLVAFFLVTGGVTMLACSVGLAAARNENTHGFYSASAIGGAIGSAVMVTVVPRVTSSPIEFSVIALSTLILAGFIWSGRMLRPFFAIVVVFAVGATIIRESGRKDNEITRARTLYSCLRVSRKPDTEYYMLINNITIHGAEDRAHPDLGLTYYGKNTGFGQLIFKKQQEKASLKVGVIGLGVGTISATMRPEDFVVYYELDPKVEELARNYFTYLKATNSTVIIGDGRKSLEESPDQNFDILVLDAFAGDAIPTHLLTKEASRIYRRHLKKDGTLIVHVTNAHVDLLPVAKGLARELGMGIVVEESGKTRWAILQPGQSTPEGKIIAWTDDRSSILDVLKFHLQDH